MALQKTAISSKKPISAFQKPLTADWTAIFKAAGKGLAHGFTGKWAELAGDTIDGVAALGLKTEPSELAYLLVTRALTKAVFDLIEESVTLFPQEARNAPDVLMHEVAKQLEGLQFDYDQRFLDKPSDLQLLQVISPVFALWLTMQGLKENAASAISKRLSSYFVFSLQEEWRRHAQIYAPLKDALDTPFTRAAAREEGWARNAALLSRIAEESVFAEPFSLRQIYIPLNAWYGVRHEICDVNESKSLKGNLEKQSRIVVDLNAELRQWLNRNEKGDSLRILSGGPGSGKSSFARIFAADLAIEGAHIVVVPLHLIDPTRSLVDEVGRFVREEGLLTQNPLEAESSETALVIVFDGLDELASQGKAAAETARAFLREVERVVQMRNNNTIRLRVIVSGRELIVQEAESEFRREGQVLNLLPYIVNADEHSLYIDPHSILKQDLRNDWWRNYGKLTRKNWPEMPSDLVRHDLEEVTSQPLLNYLVGLSYTRGELDFRGNIKLNEIYHDLVRAVYARAYERGRVFQQIRHMDFKDFMRVLEEVGLAAWHGDGRTTTVKEIQEHCEGSGLKELLKKFQEGAEAGVTSLLAAFFFQRYGERASGDRTFIFTHKSFGEYLTARRFVRAMRRVADERTARNEDSDKGLDERDTLVHWARITGPSAVTGYLLTFIRNEVQLLNKAELELWQHIFEDLFGYMLRQGMPMERLNLQTFKSATFQSRNSEEALLVALNACAIKTRMNSRISYPSSTALGTWLRKVQPQRTSAESVTALKCLSYLDAMNLDFYGQDLYQASLDHSNLHGLRAWQIWLHGASLRQVDLTEAQLGYTNLEHAKLEGTKLDQLKPTSPPHSRHDTFRSSDLSGADLSGANLRNADMRIARSPESSREVGRRKLATPDVKTK